MIQDRILITGASGFVGSRLKRLLSEKGYDVVGLSRQDPDYIIDITKHFDLSNVESFETVIHVAGKAHSVPSTFDEINEFYDVNYLGTLNLCSALETQAELPRSLIFISTVAVYGCVSGDNIKEDAHLLGKTPYAKSKIMAEKYLDEWASRNNIILGIIRLPLVAGPNAPGNLGSMINGIRTGKYLAIMGSEKIRKSVVWVDDIATIIEKLSEVGGTFNVTDGYHPSIAELENEICNKLRKKTPVSIPLALAKLLGVIGDVFKSRSPVNSDKILKMTSSLTFCDEKARVQLGWMPNKVLDNIRKIV
jgi:nucleoside-diphosphate-sugar epimerase